MTSSPNPPPRRKRFQFSLRTLMLCVLAYGALWVVTMKWGANQLAREKANTTDLAFLRANFERGDGIVTFWTGGDTPYFKDKTYSPLPFVLVWRREFTLDPTESAFDQETVLWFFGLNFKLNESGDLKNLKW